MNDLRYPKKHSKKNATACDTLNCITIRNKKSIVQKHLT